MKNSSVGFKIFLFFASAIVATIVFIPAFSLAQTAHIDLNIPGPKPADAGPIGLIQNLYDFSILAGGILAFGAIVYGGLKYTMAAGNPSKQSEGKEWIRGALLGLLLLAGAYVILNTLNPALTHPSLPTLNKIENPPATGGGANNNNTANNPGTPASPTQPAQEPTIPPPSPFIVEYPPFNPGNINSPPQRVISP